MALTKKPVNGMKDILPEEMQIRDYVIQVIKETYRSFGFTPIDTPCMEQIGNLSSKQGGENEKLIFKVLKRGEKLNLETAQSEDDVTDFGMRYDLTVPLVRFYSNNANQLPSPFKALQIGNVWRADRPQRGRYRQFMQCDIDILGESGNLAEIELILATTTTLVKLGFKNFQVRINERRILKAMAAYSGFLEEDYDTVFVILDKMDKIGLDGVAQELEKGGFAQEAIDKYVTLFHSLGTGKNNAGDANVGKDAIEKNGISYLAETLFGFLDPQVAQDLQEIISSVQAASTPAIGAEAANTSTVNVPTASTPAANMPTASTPATSVPKIGAPEFSLVFDPTLVRGMSYYTGTIFEIAMPEFGGSCGGGGRYDKMVGQFTGKDVPACGCSLGFERIILLLLENGFQIPEKPAKVAYLMEKGCSGEAVCEIMKKAQEERKKGTQVLVARMNKNKKFQKEQLTKEGYEEIEEFFV
ncbi:histidine--tRNA ligase [Lachnospiraceae bacterium ZAX-1]